jgi:arylsulfatase A-like enzyme
VTARSRPAPTALALLALLAAGAGCARETPRHVLLISIDALRADRLGAYGYAQPTSPFLDRLAVRGRVFEHAIVNTHGTTASHTTILSGLYQETHGVMLDGARGGVAVRQIPEEVPLLQETLRAHGWATLGVTDGGNAGRRFGFARGFDRFDDRGGGVEAVTERLAGWIAGALEARPDGPVFAFLHTYQVHSPYAPPRRYRERFGVPAEAPNAGSRFLLRHARSARSLEPAVLRRISGLYDAEIRYTDDTLGAFFARLEALGFLERALVVVTADHGEEMGEHGGLLHRDLLYDELLRVPLILAGEGVEAGRDRSLAGSVDVAPTVLAWAGVAPPRPLEGLALPLRGRAPSTAPRATRSAPAPGS